MNPPAEPVLRLALAQTAPVLRDVEHNARTLTELSREAAADVLLTPELSLTGYDLGDAVHGLAQTTAAAAALLDGAKGCVVAGMVERGANGPCNVALAVRDGAPFFAHRKIYLPTYGMFDEGRWFARGHSLDAFELAPGWRAGLLICEDFWHPALAYVLAMRRIDVLLVQAAAPGRGVWEGGANGAFASADVWERMVRTTAQQYGIYVALANRVGVEGAVTFAGGSVIAAPDGAVVARADDRSEQLLNADLERGALERARRPYAHGRDEDVALVLRELARAPDA
jgi:predicted amidohydrolase